MNFDLRRFFSEHGPLLVGVTALAVAVTAASVPAALKRDASAITMYPTGDGYPPIYETTEKTGCALYIDGTLVAVSESSYELEAAVDKVATELSVKENKDAEDYSIIIGKTQFLSSFGFEIDDFGINTIKVSAAPLRTGETDLRCLIDDVINEIKVHKNDPVLMRDYIIRKSCRSSIKAGYKITNEEIKSLINEISKGSSED